MQSRMPNSAQVPAELSLFSSNLAQLDLEQPTQIMIEWYQFLKLSFALLSQSMYHKDYILQMYSSRKGLDIKKNAGRFYIFLGINFFNRNG